jgi:hypothetical protein
VLFKGLSPKDFGAGITDFLSPPSFLQELKTRLEAEVAAASEQAYCEQQLGVLLQVASYDV